MSHLPIRVRLMLWYLAVFCLALTAFGVSTWTLVAHRLSEEIGQQLEARASAAERFIAAQKPGITSEHLKEELQEEYGTEDQATWLQLVDETGDWMFRAAGTAGVFPQPENPNSLPARGHFSSARSNDERLRILEKPITADGHQYTIQVGLSTRGARQTLENLRTVFLLLAPVFVLIAALGSYSISGRALRPVDQITAMARSIHDQNLDQRLPTVRTNDELQRLSDTLNEMLGRIETSFKQVRQFTADASHELRTPLSLIRTEAELTLRRSRTEEEYRNALTHVLAESVRTSDLIDSLLTLARRDSGAEQLELVPLEFGMFARRVVEEWQSLFEQLEIRFESDLPEHPVWVRADVVNLRRLLVLLLDNARKYTRRGGYVRVVAKEHGSALQIAVEDTGIGIESDHLPRIFDRFYRVDKARSRSEGGVGLGLSLAKCIAAQHRTEIGVESTPGKGSVFSFLLTKTPAPSGLPQNVEPKSETVY